MDLSFELRTSLAIVGESGSGKSLTLKAIMDILPKELKSKMVISGIDRLERGKNLSLVPQNPFTALSPMSKIKRQLWGVDINATKKLLRESGLGDDVLDRFPSELSGGQLQRVIIALSLAQVPRLLLMDEPTTALDSNTKGEIIALVKKLQKEMDFYLIFVTHELSVAKELCDEIMVIESGKKVELSAANDLFLNPKAEYTRRLLSADFNVRKFRQ